MNLPSTTIAKCEVCDLEKQVKLHYGNMYFCDDCWEKEVQATAQHQSPENQEKRVAEVIKRETETIAINQVLRKSQQIDSSIQVRTDLFNAATKSIIELKSAIDTDESITNKPYELARVLTERFQHFQKIIFDKNQEIIEAGNEQKAIQVYLNTLANQLRAEEREKLRIADINYKPNPVKPAVKTVTTRQTKKSTKIDKTELRNAAKQLGISEFILQTVIVQKNLTVKEAVIALQKSIAEAKQSS